MTDTLSRRPHAMPQTSSLRQLPILLAAIAFLVALASATRLLEGPDRPAPGPGNADDGAGFTISLPVNDGPGLDSEFLNEAKIRAARNSSSPDGRSWRTFLADHCQGGTYRLERAAALEKPDRVIFEASLVADPSVVITVRWRVSAMGSRYITVSALDSAEIDGRPVRPATEIAAAIKARGKRGD
jgi:hypothetical protein